MRPRRFVPEAPSDGEVSQSRGKSRKRRLLDLWLRHIVPTSKPPICEQAHLDDLVQPKPGQISQTKFARFEAAPTIPKKQTTDQ